MNEASAETSDKPGPTINVPIFGPCRLVLQVGDVPPSGFGIGYVRLQGNNETFKLAFYRDGKWQDHKLRNFPAPVVNFCKLVRADGSPVL